MARKNTGRVAGGKDADGLTRYERRFVDEYVIDLNGSKALRRMGFNGAHIKQAAHQLRTKNPAVEAAIEKSLLAIRERARVTQDDVIEEYRRIGFANIQDVITVDANGNETVDLLSIPRDRAAAISEFKAKTVPIKKRGKVVGHELVSVEVKQHSKLHALDKLGVHLGIFREDVVIGIPVRFIIEGDPASAPKKDKAA